MNRASRSKICVFVFLLSSFFYILSSAPIIHAQLTTGLTSDDISTDVEPQNPGPGQTVTIDISSFATNLDAVNISWSVDGKIVQSGIGKKHLDVTSKALGQKTTIAINIDSVTGTIEKDITLIPATIDLIWEANTYTPPFFKGKALFSPQSSVTFIAQPHILRNGNQVTPANLIYKWTQNGTVLGSNGGYGKNTLTINGSLLPRPMDIQVEASDPLSGAVADGEISLAPQTPFVLLYRDDPLYGIEYEHALSGNYTMTKPELHLAAIPYHFSTPTLGNAVLTYQWSINGNPLDDGYSSFDKIFRTSGTSGVSNISVEVDHANASFQTANTAISVQFNANSSTSL